MVAELRRCADAQSRYPRVIFFTQASVEATTDFFRERWPSALVVADPERWFYGAFGRRRAKVWELLSFGVLRATLRAWRGGHRIGRVVGDARTMPGLFLVAEGRIRWEHVFDHAGDHPDFAAIPSHLG